MKIKFKGSFTPHKIQEIAAWIKEHLTDITIMDKPIYALECKIIKVNRDRILVEGE